MNQTIAHEGKAGGAAAGVVYVSYDIRGIQQNIFAVPRLKYIVGASALIAEFGRGG